MCIVIIILHVRTRVDPTAVLILILINHYENGLLRPISNYIINHAIVSFFHCQLRPYILHKSASFLWL